MTRHRKFFTRDRQRAIKRFFRALERASAAPARPPEPAGPRRRSALDVVLWVLVIVPVVACTALVAFALINRPYRDAVAPSRGVASPAPPEVSPADAAAPAHPRARTRHTVTPPRRPH